MKKFKFSPFVVRQVHKYYIVVIVNVMKILLIFICQFTYMYNKNNRFFFFIVVINCFSSFFLNYSSTFYTFIKKLFQFVLYSLHAYIDLWIKTKSRLFLLKSLHHLHVKKGKKKWGNQKLNLPYFKSPTLFSFSFSLGGGCLKFLKYLFSRSFVDYLGIWAWNSYCLTCI